MQKNGIIPTRILNKTQNFKYLCLDFNSQRDQEDIQCSSRDGGADRALNGRVLTTPSSEISSLRTTRCVVYKTSYSDFRSLAGFLSFGIDGKINVLNVLYVVFYGSNFHARKLKKLFLIRGSVILLF